MITVSDAQKAIARRKLVVVPMSWVKELHRREPAWYEYRSALQFEDDPTETPEGLSVVCQWKPKSGVKPENWKFGLLYRAERIYAIDLQPLAYHTNRVGHGRHYYRQRVQGSHEHTWSGEGYGYAEPFTLGIGGEEAWQEFLHRAGINDAPFEHPDPAVREGQQRLDI